MWSRKKFSCFGKLVFEFFGPSKDRNEVAIIDAAESVLRRHRWRGKNPRVPGARLWNYVGPPKLGGPGVLVIQIIAVDGITPGQFRAFYLYLETFSKKLAETLKRRGLNGKRIVTVDLDLNTHIDFPPT